MTYAEQTPVELESNIISASVATKDEINDMSAPSALLLQVQQKMLKKVVFWESEPWDKHTEQFTVTLSREAWEAQGSPENLWVSLMTIAVTPTPEKENDK